MEKLEIKVSAGDIMTIDDTGVEFLRHGTGWSKESTGATGNQYAGRISDPHTARIVAYHLLIWAEEKERTGKPN